MTKLFSKAHLFLSLVMLLLARLSFAAHEPVSARLSSPSFVNGSSLFVMDNKYLLISGGGPLNFRDAGSKTRVIIGIDKANTDVLAAYDYSFEVTLNYYTWSGSVLTPVTSTHTLNVSYDPAQGGINYHDLAVLEVNGGYLVNAQVTDIINNATSTSVTNPPANLYFETEIDAERYYNMDFINVPYVASSVHASIDATTDEILVTWPNIVGAEEYDLEWAWVTDNSMASFGGVSGPFNYVLDFKSNSTRIRTGNQVYRISNVFEKGKLFFRVRGVGYTDLSADGIFKQVYFTPWTFGDYTSISYAAGLAVACPGTPNAILCITDDHEKNKNWQYKATYAEEGKKKEVVSYFDGTLRNRQSVTKSNSDENSIVAETYYDYQGRPAVQALPVPTTSANIKFYQYNVAYGSVTNNWGFNFVDNTHEVFDREFFDKDGGTCDAGGAGLEDDLVITPGGGGSSYGIGTANYYSSYNVNKTFQQGYVPDAGHFPYTQTEYTPDNTGRISRQSGVGPMHQLGTGHETKYFYGSPTLQEELDRLFGSDVGDYKHYKKNLVIDANGQVSISYLDQEGRTVATALAGPAPANTYSLASNTGTSSVSGNLLNKDAPTDVDDEQDNNILGDGGKSLSFSQEILVGTQGTYKFDYDMTGTAFTYACSEENICYDCIYDLEINIVDKCGENPERFAPITKKVGNILESQIDEAGNLTVNYSCDGPIQFNMVPSPLTVSLKPGAYTVYKTLKIDEKALADYLKHYIDNNPCIKTEADFISTATANIGATGCDLTCEECVTALGSEEDFIANGGTATLYIEAIKACREPCEYKSSCEAAYIAMLADLSPGGQYAEWESGSDCDPSVHSLSVLNEGNVLPKWTTTPTAHPDWRHPVDILGTASNYRDANGDVSYIRVIRQYNPGTSSYDYNPTVRSTASGDLIPDANNPNLFTTLPQNLKEVCEFKSRWKSSWASALLVYHPEFPYYEWCLKNEKDNVRGNNYTVDYQAQPLPHAAATGSVYTSVAFDSLLTEIQNPSLIVNSSDIPKIYDPLGIVGSNIVSDPYFDTGEPASKWVLPNAITADASGTTEHNQLTAGAFVVPPYPKLYTNAEERFNNYLGSGLNLWEFTYAIIKGYATQYGSSISSQYGTTWFGSPFSTYKTAPANSVIAGSHCDYRILMTTGGGGLLTQTESEEAWEKFKFMYLSLKQTMQNEAAQSYAINHLYYGAGSDASAVYNQCNDCIGNGGYNPFIVPFTKWRLGYLGTAGLWGLNWFNEPMFSYSTYGHKAPCGLELAGYYATRVKRFPSTADALGLGSDFNIGGAIYGATGKCPSAQYLENFIRELAVTDKITTDISNLQTISGFSQGLYDFLYANANGGALPSSYPVLNWDQTVTGNVLTGAIGSLCNDFSLTFPSNPQGYTWSNINTSPSAVTGVYGLKVLSNTGGTSDFTVVFRISDATTTYTYLVSGTSCGNMMNCTFDPVCKANSNASTFKNLYDLLAKEGVMCSTTNVDLTTFPFNSVFASIVPVVGAGTWTYNHVTATTGEIYDVSASNPIKIIISTSGSGDFNKLCPGTNEVVNVVSILPNALGSTGDCIIGYSTLNTSTGAVVTGTIAANISFDTGVSTGGFNLGTCEEITSMNCSTNDHKVKAGLENFLSGNNVVSLTATYGWKDITATPNFTGLLKNHIGSHPAYSSGSGLLATPHYYLIRDGVLSDDNNFVASICSGTTVVTSPSVPSTGQMDNCCSLNLKFKDTPLLGHTFPNIVSMDNMIVLQTPAVSGHYYSFNMTAHFSDGLTEVITGSTSCFPLLECMDCTKGEGIISSVILEDFEGSMPVYNNGFTSDSQPAGACEHLSPVFTDGATSFTAQDEYTHSASMSFASGTISGYDHKSGFVKTSDCFSSFILYDKTIDFNSLQEGISHEGQCFTISLNYSLQSPTPAYFDLYIDGMLQASKGVTANAPSWGLLDFNASIIYNGTHFPGGNVPVKIVARSNNASLTNTYAYGIDNITVKFSYKCNWTCVPNVPLEPFPSVTYTNPCYQSAIDDAVSEGLHNYGYYIDSLRNDFVDKYIKKCMGDVVENFYLDYASRDYHYTLYYYDQAGNLVQTIPPQGVVLLASPSDLAASRSARAGGTQFATSHRMGTTYSYNSLNQLVKQTTPDGGESNFWYDKLGRLVLSQNAKQLANSSAGSNLYSYTDYDALGRIVQVGEMTTDEDFLGATPTDLLSYLDAISLPLFPYSLSVAGLAQVTNTYYGDDLNYYTGLSAVPAAEFSDMVQAYSRGRVVASTIEDTDDSDPTTYDHATYYSYDVHGNVKELLQHNPHIGFGQNFKQTKYEYDLVSGKVNGVAYQPGKGDQFYHRYGYDADNRITSVLTSNNKVIWNQDAKYFYYLHGPLARVELGDDKVQGTDYAYTIQGWIKGVNSDKLDEVNDIGKDGNLLGTTTNYNNLHKHIARDAFGYSLNYFSNATDKDYIAIDNSLTAATRFAADATALNITGTTPVMYNGNIASMVTTYLNRDPLATNMSSGAAIALNEPYAQANAYAYDQLNRVRQARSSRDYNPSTNVFGAATDDKLNEAFTYDANGNITTADRYGNGAKMDEMEYHYYKQGGGTYSNSSPAPADATNKLAYVSDNASLSGNYTDDIDNQAVPNYTYDAIGNLIADASEEIATIEWTVYGKIKSITHLTGSTKTDLEFAYDAAGNRIMKKLKLRNGSGGYIASSRWHYTYYVRDAQGHVMAVYNKGPNFMDIPEVRLSEQHIYGSSRLGVFNNSTDQLGAITTTTVNRTLGLKSYELSNHLGNVIAVVSDKKTGVDSDNDGIIDYFSPDVLSNTDYYAFGQPMPGRSFNSGDYKYGFNGKENDKETVGTGQGTQDYGMRIYNPALGRFLSVDPLQKEYPELTPYQFASNTPIQAIDLDGLEMIHVSLVKKDGKPQLKVNSVKFEYLDGTKIEGWHYNVEYEGKHYSFDSSDDLVNWAVNGATGVTSEEENNAPLLQEAAALTLMGAHDAMNDALATGNSPDVVPPLKSEKQSVDKSEKQTASANNGVKTQGNKKTHGNKLNDTPAEGYTLRDKASGKVKKYGETTRGEDKFGEGNQKRYTKKELKEKDVYYQKETSGTKKDMHKWQHDKILEHKDKNNGNRPDLNKSDY